VLLFYHLTYLVGNCRDLNVMNVALNFPNATSLQYQDIKRKTVTVHVLFYLLIIQLTVYKRTIRRFCCRQTVGLYDDDAMMMNYVLKCILCPNKNM